mmetsp:Transcript_104463/g.294422  ORF Transcript_104463/g.294422 Transcript_104463/m.294422 type:complete len:318 (+) Transcript_104463:64-1017(+)
MPAPVSQRGCSLWPAASATHMSNRPRRSGPRPWHVIVFVVMAGRCATLHSNMLAFCPRQTSCGRNMVRRSIAPRLPGRLRCVATSMGGKATPFSCRALLFTRTSFLVAGLAFLAGWADVVCYMRCHCYGIMMTGNTIAMAAAVAHLRLADVAFFSSMLLAYVGGVALFGRAQCYIRHRPSTGVIAAALLLLFASSDLLALCCPGSRWYMSLVAFGLAIINALSSTATGTITCLVTGHLQRLGGCLGEYFGSGLNEKQKSSSVISLVVLGMLCAGVACGTLAVYYSPCAALRGLFSRFSFLGFLYTVLLALHDSPWLS